MGTHVAEVRSDEVRCMMCRNAIEVRRDEVTYMMGTNMGTTCR
jgi:hypothetical protein